MCNQNDETTFPQEAVCTTNTSDNDDKDDKQKILDAMWEASQKGDDLLTAVKDTLTAINAQKSKSKEDDDTDDSDDN